MVMWLARKKCTEIHERIGGNMSETTTVNMCPTHGEYTNEQGCLICSNDITTDSPVYLYFIKCSDDEETFYRFTMSLATQTQRIIGDEFPYKYEIMHHYSGTAEYCFEKEKQFHEQFSPYKYQPKLEFIGRDECYCPDVEV